MRFVSEMVELFPYDLLIFATHCGDAPGYRWTFEYRDSEGIDRTLVVDIAIGVGQTDDPEILHVSQFHRFHSLDGVDWNDTKAKADLYVGTAIKDYVERERGPDGMKPVIKDTIPRVKGSAVLKMSDDNFIPTPSSLANQRTPIIINNSCWSWHELAARFTFGNARAYVGTLYPISGIEAQEVTNRLLAKFFGKALPHALWERKTLYMTMA